MSGRGDAELRSTPTADPTGVQLPPIGNGFPRAAVAQPSATSRSGDRSSGGRTALVGPDHRRHVQPVRPGGEVDLDRHVERQGRGHRLARPVAPARDLRVGGLEDQLVVDLEQHPGPQPCSRIRAVDVEHRPLDQVGGRALDHRVDGGPLGQVRSAPVGVLDAADRPAAAEDRLDPARRLGRLQRPGDERVDARILARSRRR